MIEVVATLGSRTDRAETDDPAAAIYAASVLLREIQDTYYGRPTAAFYTDGVLVREGVTLADLGGLA